MEWNGLRLSYKVKNKMENINKSIIYGNIHENRYGKFLPICSSINDRSKKRLMKTM